MPKKKETTKKGTTKKGTGSNSASAQKMRARFEDGSGVCFEVPGQTVADVREKAKGLGKGPCTAVEDANTDEVLWSCATAEAEE